MTLEEFYERLAFRAFRYGFYIMPNGWIRERFWGNCPISAVCDFVKGNSFIGLSESAAYLGLSTEDALYIANMADGNIDNTELRKVLGL